jgi:hypothetical protein
MNALFDEVRRHGRKLIGSVIGNAGQDFDIFWKTGFAETFPQRGYSV